MVKHWLRRVILWALDETPDEAPAGPSLSTRLFDEWLNGGRRPDGENG